jgi:hypothetical protein
VQLCGFNTIVEDLLDLLEREAEVLECDESV